MEFPLPGREYAARWVLGTLGTSPRAGKPEDDICGAVAATNSVGGEERTAHKWCQTRRV